MKTLETDPARIWSLWEICQQAYLRHGRKLQFPSDTDPKKTYQWRYLSRIAEKFDEWDFDEQTIEKFIEVAVRHAKEVGVLHKGLAALHQKNLMELCYESLQSEEETSNQQLAALRVTKNWLVGKIGKKDPVKVLLARPEVDSWPNLILWYQANKISKLYLALSRSCYKALHTLEKQNSDELILMPKTSDLYWTRKDFVASLEDEKQAKTILQNDWRNLCR
jgi:hypothetical protein